MCSPPWWGVPCWRVASLMAGRPALLWGPPHGGACCVGASPASWWGVLCGYVARLMVGPAVLMSAGRGGCAWCGGAGLGLWFVLPGNRRRWCQVGGVLAGATGSLFCWCGVVFAALWPAYSGGCGRRSSCGWGCVVCLAGVGAVLVRGPPHGRACCVGARPPPTEGHAVSVCGLSHGGELCWRVARLMVGRAALLCGPPNGGGCCAGARPPSWWGVLCCCLPAAVVVRGVVVLGLGCRRVCRLAAGAAGVGLVVLVVVF